MQSYKYSADQLRKADAEIERWEAKSNQLTRQEGKKGKQKETNQTKAH